MSFVLSAAMLASGAAALIFETLWFRQTGLVVGNGVWASSLALAAFMAGLALGNAAVARFGTQVRSPIRLYAGLEGAIACAGVLLVWTLPLLAGGLAPLWRLLPDVPLFANALRLLISFTLLLIPSVAMGATLPLLVKVLLDRDPNFGSVLGRLYGCNTLGAVVGAVISEVVLLEALGVEGTAYVAASLNLLAAAAALLALSLSQSAAVSRVPERAAKLRLTATTWQPLLAVFLSGAIVLSLEVVWFRFLELFVWNSGASFALMLAVVLAGIGLGGGVAGIWLRITPDADRHSPFVAILAGTAALVGYSAFSGSFSKLMGGPESTDLVIDSFSILALSVTLTFPDAFFSGVLFTLIGTSLQRVVGSEVLTTGLLTLSNTLGGAIGALAGGFLFLPFLGIENALFLLASLYGFVGLLLLVPAKNRPRATFMRRLIWTTPLAIAILSFPFGAMRGEHLGRVSAAHGFDNDTSAAVVRETRTETLLLLRRQFLGETLNHLLVTGGFGMASTDEWSRRYMKQFVYLPLNLHANPKRALLISFGSGSTAKALQDVENLESIDVVDISRDILGLSDVVYPAPGANPLEDSRFESHVGDGRFFLLATDRRYDLITSEPPPPKHAGVENLYTQEFFELVKGRLADGGINSHWLPTHALTYDDTRAIVRAYCAVFEDCTLWRGINLNWMLMGSRNADWSTTESEFLERWEGLAAAREGRMLGVEVPEQIGAMFLADATTLGEWTADVAPLRDGFPKRVSDAPPAPEDYWALRQWMNPRDAREHFLSSAFIANAWPDALKNRSSRFFRFDGLVDDVFLQHFGSPPSVVNTIEVLDSVLAESELERLPAWLLGAHGDYVAAIARNPRLRDQPVSLRMQARDAIGRRDYALASELFGRLESPAPEALFLDAYATAMRGDASGATDILRRNEFKSPELPWAWLDKRFDLAAQRDPPQI